MNSETKREMRTEDNKKEERRTKTEEKNGEESRVLKREAKKSVSREEAASWKLRSAIHVSLKHARCSGKNCQVKLQ
jgi:hypothetical protein